ncbi:MarR family winged helix-turn-helix transcriptional regulator [Streptomyces sp. NPDC088725]|uniref:MarR family winged helix-turn-helix transcriptional regulator n=1 Tax=Streptomyces sp. NPDC088725 TaxID=3365873 RepID=UPI003815B20C
MIEVIEVEGRRNPAEVAVRLSVAVTRLRSRLREEAGMTSSGFTISQLAILQRIIEGGPATAAALAAAEHVSQQAVAQSVAALKAGALVGTERDTADRRKVLISATDEGRELFASLLASREAWLVRAIDAMVGPDERRDLDVTIELLERLAAADPEQRTGTGLR